jgi:hypothetical protein
MRVAGLHISGPNSPKSAIVILDGSPLPMNITGLYEKIGSQGKLFSDDRFVDILSLAGPFNEVFVDCPLSLPPCVACERPVCPGVAQCEDVSVAYMLSLTAKLKARGSRKKRPVNPQSQRLWDIMYQSEMTHLPAQASYSANLAPLVVRAKTLQRRLNTVSPPIKLKETAVAYALEALCTLTGLSEQVCREYRSFENGLQHREEIIERFIEIGWVSGKEELANLETVIHSVECFSAFVAGLMAAFCHVGISTRAPKTFIPHEGWVYLPQLACDLESGRD